MEGQEDRKGELKSKIPGEKEWETYLVYNVKGPINNLHAVVERLILGKSHLVIFSEQTCLDVHMQRINL